MQSKTLSMLETITSTVIGFIVSMALTAIMFQSLTWSENVSVVMVFTIASVIRGYAIRRVFNSMRGI